MALARAALTSSPGVMASKNSCSLSRPLSTTIVVLLSGVGGRGASRVPLGPDALQQLTRGRVLAIVTR
jgi:hypothetical protein